MQMKHIIYECLHLSRSVPISYKEKIYFYFFIIFIPLCSSSQTGKDDKHHTHRKQAQSAFSQAVYHQRVNKLGSWWLGDRGGDVRMADTGKLAQ